MKQENFAISTYLESLFRLYGEEGPEQQQRNKIAEKRILEYV